MRSKGGKLGKGNEEEEEMKKREIEGIKKRLQRDK